MQRGRLLWVSLSERGRKQMCKSVIIIGAGGHSKPVADVIRASGDEVFGFLDDTKSSMEVIGKIDDCIKYSDKYFIIAIGDNLVRKSVEGKYPGLKYYTAVHPRAIVSETAKIGVGTVVMPNSVVNADAIVGNHCIINTASVVEHDCNIGDYVHISPGAVLCGTVKVGSGTQIGAGSVVRNGISIVEDSVIGCGAAVVKDIDVSGVYVGVPAKEIK